MVEEFENTRVGVIPNDWKVETLGDVGEVKMCRRVFNHETQSEGTIPFYKIGTFGKDADAYIPEDLYNSYRQKFSFPKKGDILISAAGTIGRTLIYDGKPAYFQDSNIVWIDNKETLISNNFLYHVFQVVKYSTEGGTIQRLYNSILKSTKFFCPPTKTEQAAIATALNDTDALITQLDKLIAKKRAIKQGTMQELLKPKKGCGVKKLGEIGDCIIGLTYSPLNVKKDGLLVLRSSNIQGNKLVYDDNVFVNVGVSERLTTKNGDILICVRNGSRNLIGKCAFINGRGVGETFGAFMSVFRSQFNEYVYHVLQSNIIKRQIEETIGATINQLTNKNLNSFEIPFPKPDEQIYIAKILSDMDVEIEILEKKLEKYKMLKQGMIQNLLTGKIRLI